MCVSRRTFCSIPSKVLKLPHGISLKVLGKITMTLARSVARGICSGVNWWGSGTRAPHLTRGAAGEEELSSEGGCAVGIWICFKSWEKWHRLSRAVASQSSKRLLSHQGWWALSGCAEGAHRAAASGGAGLQIYLSNLAIHILRTPWPRDSQCPQQRTAEF